MSSLFDNVNSLPNEWILVVGAGLMFFLVQLVLTVSYCSRLQWQEGAIRLLLRNFEQGVVGQQDLRRPPAKPTWTQWVVSHYPMGTPPSTANFTREDALQELDMRIASDGNYLLLQRMGVMAPLLGVVLTVAGFYWLQVGEEDQSLQSIFLAVTPLVSGVGTGAVLALINQVLLHIAGQRVESLRTTARHWFDSVIWDTCGGQGTTVKSVEVLEHFVRNALEDIDRLSDTLARAAEISVAIDGLPDQMRSILDRKLSADHGAALTSAKGPFVTRLPRTAR